MWTSVGDQTHCALHDISTDRGVPCPSCVANPKIALSDRDVVHVQQRRNTAFYEDRLLIIADSCEKIAAELLAGDRDTISERTEPAALAAKFLEVSARSLGRCIDVAAKREDREELESMQRTIREMQGAH